MLTAVELESTIERLGDFQCYRCASAIEAVDILSKKEIDLAILDINIQGEKDGIWIAEYMSRTGGKFIFLTSHQDGETIRRATEHRPLGYIIKPFNASDIEANLSIALNQIQAPNLLENAAANNSIFVKDSYNLVRIVFDEIHFIKSDKNYLEVYFHDQRQLIRSTLTDFLKVLPKNLFAQVHRSYVINIRFVSKINSQNLIVGEREIPMSSQFRDALIERIRLYQ